MLRPTPLPPIPSETQRLGQMLYEPENVYRQIGDLFADAFCDEQFAAMYSPLGQPALSPALLSLVSILQYLEHLSDRQALVMVRSRIDWKYALHLPLEAPGFDPSVLCEFRTRLVEHEAERLLFDTVLERLKALDLLKGRRLQRTDSLVIVSAVRQLNRLELAVETVRVALEAIAKADAEWLRARMPSGWLERYGEWTQARRQTKQTGARGQAETTRLLASVGADGAHVLAWLGQEPGPGWREEPAAIATLREVWRQQFRAGEGGEREPSTAATRRAEGVGGDLVTTPHDPEVRYRAKGRGEEGYKLQLTETADEGALGLITDVAVEKLTAYEGDAVEAIQERLQQRGLLPQEHLVDAGYVDGTTLGESAARGVELVGPIQERRGGQPKRRTTQPGKREPDERFEASAFGLDVARREARCPAGEVAARWHDGERRDARRAGVRMWTISWSARVCGACALVARCVGERRGGRVLHLHPNQELMAARRAEQRGALFQERYRRRAGIEATFSALVRRGGRRSRYRGRAKTLFQYAAAASAINLKRVAAHRAGVPVVRSRSARLRRLMGEVGARAKGWGQNLRSRERQSEAADGRA
jgi:transposase